MRGNTNAGNMEKLEKLGPRVKPRGSIAMRRSSEGGGPAQSQNTDCKAEAERNAKDALAPLLSLSCAN